MLYTYNGYTFRFTAQQSDPGDVVGVNYYHTSGGEYAPVIVGCDNGSLLCVDAFFKIYKGVSGISLLSDDTVEMPGGTESRQNYTQVQHFLYDSDVLTETNGGNLLQLANKFKDEFFDGETQTSASLFEKMEFWYGEAGGFYAPMAMSTNWLPLNFMGATINQFQSITCQVPYAIAQDFPHVYPAYWTNEGDNYGNAAPVYPASVETITDKEQYIIASLIFGDIRPQDRAALHFDVYVQGNDGPTVDVKWKVINASGTFSAQTVRPQMWRYWKPLAFIEDDLYTTDENNVVVPSETAERIHKGYAFSQSEHFTYLGAFQNETSELSTPMKTAFYGIDGIAGAVILLLRFDQTIYQGQQQNNIWGDLVRVYIPYKRNDDSECTETLKANSSYNAEFSTTCTIHFTAPETDPEGGEDNDDPPPPTPPQPDPPFPEDEPVGFPGKAILTQTYCMGETALENIGSKLWSQSYFDVLKIQNNPIENIISCKWYPFNLDGVARSVKVGNIDFQTQGTYVRENRYISNWMSYTYTGEECTWHDPLGKTYKLPKYMCCSPYTRLKLHLPYAGVVELDASDFINNELRVRFVVDLVSGDMLYFLQCGSSHAPYMTVAGKMGVDIPLTASNRAQTELAVASKTLSAVIGAAGSLATGQALGAAAYGTSVLSAVGMDYTTQRTSTQSPTCASFENLAIFLEVIFPQHKKSAGFGSSHGYPTHLSKKLSDCSGFVKVDARTKIDVAMSEEENRMLEELLTNGIYV